MAFNSHASRMFAGAAVTAALTVAPALSASAGDETGSDASLIEVYAEVERSIVHLQIDWTGYVQYPTATGWAWSDPITLSTGCTGFFVDDLGGIITAGHCVDGNQGRRERTIVAFLDQLLAEGSIEEEDYDPILEIALAEWAVEGQAEGAPIDRTVWVYQPNQAPERVLDTDYIAQVVDFRPFTEGDVALLRIELEGTPPLTIAADDAEPGTAVTAVGFPQSVPSTTGNGTVRASFKSGTISSWQTTNTGVPVMEVNAEVDFGMSGGPTIDEHGNVLGVNSFGAQTDGFNFITDTTDLGDWLRAQGVSFDIAEDESSASQDPGTAQSATGEGATRALPAAVGAGGVVALLVTAAVTLLLTRRTKAPADAPAPLGFAAPGVAPAAAATTVPVPAAAAPAGTPPGEPWAQAMVR